MFPALQERDFRVLWIGMLPGVLAMQMNFFTNGYLAFELTGAASSIGFISMGFGIPMLFLSLVGGVVADRYSKRRILLFSQLVTVASAFAMAMLVITDAIRLWHMVVLSLFLGSAFTFHMPARQSFVAELISRERLMNAVALNGAGLNACRIAGPPLAGWLIGRSWMNTGGVYLIMTLMYAFVIVTLFRIEDRGSAIQTHDSRGWSSMVEGVSYIWRNRTLTVLLVLSVAPIIFGMPFQALMPVFAKRVFNVGPVGLGMLMMANGVGALLGSLVIASIHTLKRAGIVQLSLGVLFGITLSIFAFNESFYLSLPILFAAGAVSSGYFALNATLIMDRSEPRYHGRVMSVYMLTFSAAPFGNLVMSLFADVLGPQATVGYGGITLVVIVLFSWLSSSVLRGI
ncbi:MAG: MFS transporter [Syntrophales bacterium]|nr:MFS transporter [Syntrophales bacterium]